MRLHHPSVLRTVSPIHLARASLSTIVLILHNLCYIEVQAWSARDALSNGALQYPVNDRLGGVGIMMTGHSFILTIIEQSSEHSSIWLPAKSMGKYSTFAFHSCFKM